MLNIQQFRYGADNFAYLIHGNRQAIAVDGGAWKEILSFLKQNGLSLELVTNTHAHYDHTSGNEHLIKATGAAFLKSSMFADNHTMMIDGEAILVYRTPGHTNDSVCFHTGHSLISGDTLFNATIGNCFSCNLHHFYSSIKRLMNLPDETIIYAGHDYLRDSLAFARHLEPDNDDIESLRKICSAREILYTTLAEERRVNPYLRFNEESIVEMLRKRNLPCATEVERWNSLMSVD
ncbi:MAG: MBL fold metallo-hydrolase [Smithella sp.]|nr:MBL fold metallo-hydrolase [Smithella sp.]